MPSDPTPSLSSTGLAREGDALRQAIEESMPAGVVAFDEKGRPVYVNQAFCRMVGWSQAELLGAKPPFVYWPPEEHETIAQTLAQTLKGEAPPAGFELKFLRRSGERFHVLLQVSPLPGHGPGGGESAAGWVACVCDVTERKLAERERAELLDREQAARGEMERAIQAKDEFLAILSHELRTPLTPVLTAVQLMERDRTLSPEQYEIIAMIRRNIQLEARLIDDLLDLTRISRGKLELFLAPADLHEKIRHVAGICEGEIRSKYLTLKLELTARQCHVMADPARLQQMVWNLLKNAVKFTPGGGTIHLRTVDHHDGRVRMQVIDNGAGIPPQLLPSIFEAFVQGGREITRQHGGLGLGLTISRRLAEMHGGTLVAESAGLGKGSTFTLDLPVAPKPQVEQAPHAPELSGMDLERRILLVEDNIDTRRVMSKLLELDGYDVRTADSVASALRAAEAESFDLLICDIGLPDGSGLDLMRQLLSRSFIKGIALSGFGMEEDVRKSKEAGFLEHLTKPVNLHHLEAVIRRVAATTGSAAVD